MKLEDIKRKTKDALDHLVQSLESGQSAVLTQYLGGMARFHTYSFGNVMLIASQKPDATKLAGIRTWNSLGRFVKRGEKGILILAPMVGKNHKQKANAKQVEDTKEKESKLFGFRAVYVFDISQTEGKDLPALTEVQGDVSGSLERLLKFVQGVGIELNYSERIAPAKGLSRGGTIMLLPGMQPAQEFSTLVHETAHELLHGGDRRTLTTKQVRETEAEAVAFVVCQALGLETGTASQDYIQIWRGDANLLRESLEAVQHTAAVILGAISPEDTGNHLRDHAVPTCLDATLRFKMGSMPNGYEAWIREVQEALSSINMSMEDWQNRWPFDFQAEYKVGMKAVGAAMKANRFWWFEQNKSLKQECRLTLECWLPSGHQGTCQPLNSDSHANPPQPCYERGDFVKVEFPDETTGIGEWMWVRVIRNDEERQVVFGVLDNEPLNDYERTVGLGTELAVHYSQIREHRKPTEFTRQ